jgi:hypothetical protein
MHITMTIANRSKSDGYAVSIILASTRLDAMAIFSRSAGTVGPTQRLHKPAFDLRVRHEHFIKEVLLSSDSNGLCQAMSSL